MTKVEAKSTFFSPTAVLQMQDDAEARPFWGIQPITEADLEGIDPKLLYDQNLTVPQISTLTKQLMHANSMISAMKAHRPMPDYLLRAQKRMMQPFLARNIQAREHGIYLPNSTRDEINFARLWFLSEFPSDMDLYESLGPAYRAFHGLVVGRVPGYFLEHEANDFIDFRLPVPIATVPIDRLGSQEVWYAQDYLERVILAGKVVEDVQKVQQAERDKITLIDYASGSGELSQIVLDRIKDAEITGVSIHLVLIDLAPLQIEAAKEKLDTTISEWGNSLEVTFLNQSVTQEVPQTDHNSYVIGFSSFTAGAMPPSILPEWAQKIQRVCNSFHAVDFSNPAGRENIFLDKTGESGKSYLRLMRPGNLYHTLSRGVFTQGLAAHYRAWPGRGHNAGYFVEQDGMLTPPAIQTLGENLRGNNHSTSTFGGPHSFSMVYVNSTRDGHAHLGILPGWISERVDWDKDSFGTR